MILLFIKHRKLTKLNLFTNRSCIMINKTSKSPQGKWNRSRNFIPAQRCEIFISEKFVNSIIKTFHCKCVFFFFFFSVRILHGLSNFHYHKSFSRQSVLLCMIDVFGFWSILTLQKKNTYIYNFWHYCRALFF